MIIWTEKELNKLIEYYQLKYNEAEKEIQNTSYPPNEELEMEKSQAIIWLINDMLNEKSWIYKLANN